MAKFRPLFCALLALTLFATAGVAASLTDSLKPGKVDLKSAGALAFGPDAVLFVGDSIGATIYAIDTGDRTASQATALEVKGVGDKIAGLLGTMPNQIQINDVAVNPISKKAYISVARGRGPDAAAVIVRIDPAGKMDVLALDNVKFSSATIPNPVSAEPQNQRLQTITDLAFVDNQVLVAGLTNEEFSSNMRNIPFPFATAGKGAGIEIWHGSHGRFETNSPVRTFVPYKIKNEEFVLAAYTCTPLVKIPVASLKPGAQVKGTTIAELGAGNRPLDMIVYTKGGKNFILMNNSNLGVLKLSAEGLEAYQPITKPINATAGVQGESIQGLKGVVQLDTFDGQRALIMESNDGTINLRTIALP